MKRLILMVVIAGALVVSGINTASAKELKTAYINLSEVFDAYNKTKTFDKQLQDEAEVKRVEREKMVEEVKKLRDELELLSPDARAAKQQSVDEKVQELQAFDRDSRLTLRKKRDEMIRDILKEIDDVVQKYGKDKGYDFIFNDRVLLYKLDSYDVSEDITKLLNGR